MRIKKGKSKYLVILTLLLTAKASFGFVFAYVGESANYWIQSDEINIGGTENQTSSNYKMADTIGSIASGQSTSGNYKLKAGYRQISEDFYISISAPSNVDLGVIPGLAGGAATNSAIWTVITDNPAGYNIGVKSSTEPAMQSASSTVADYTPAKTPSPDFTWTLGSAVAEFGYAPYNASSSVARYKNDGTDCASGTSVTDAKCWDAFSSSTVAVANRTTRTEGAGEDNKVNFKAEVNTANSYQESGTYTATITATAVAN